MVLSRSLCVLSCIAWHCPLCVCVFGVALYSVVLLIVSTYTFIVFLFLFFSCSYSYSYSVLRLL